jgi:hypothetical protein
MVEVVPRADMSVSVRLACRHEVRDRVVRDREEVQPLLDQWMAEIRRCRCDAGVVRACSTCTRWRLLSDLQPDGPLHVRCTDNPECHARPLAERRFGVRRRGDRGGIHRIPGSGRTGP